MDYGCVIRPLKIDDFTPTVSWAQLEKWEKFNVDARTNTYMFI